MSEIYVPYILIKILGEGDYVGSREKEFEQYLIENGIGERTIVSYVGDIVMFNRYLQEQDVKEIEQLKRFYVVSYKKKLQEQGYAIATINKKMNSIQAYNLFLINKGIMKEQVVFLRKDQIKIANGSQKQVEVLTEEQVDRLLFFVQDQEKVSQRNELIVHLLLYTGVRVSELCAIKIKDIDMITHTLDVFGKGGKHREVPLKAELVEKIRAYMKEDRKKSYQSESEYLLVSQRAPKLVRDSINHLLRLIGEQLDIKLYPHLFRHTFATRLIQNNVNITTVAKICGHHSTAVTSEFYVEISRELKQSAVELL